MTVILSTGQSGGYKSPVSYDVGSIATAVGLGDFNLDGRLDVAVAGWRSTTFYPYPIPPVASSLVTIPLGNGDGTLSFWEQTVVDNAFLRDMVVADLNGDGRKDLAMTSTACLGFGTGCFDKARTAVVVMLATPAGFPPPATFYAVGAAGGDRPRKLALGDLDGDGKLDVATINQESATITMLMGNGDGTFGARSDMFATGLNEIAIADMDGDGHQDLIDDNCVFLNNGPVFAISESKAVTAGLEQEARVRPTVTPNPVRGQATLSFGVARPGPVTVKLYDVSGRVVRTLWTGDVARAGRLEVRVEARGDGGIAWSPGMYFYRIDSQGGSRSGPLLVIK